MRSLRRRRPKGPHMVNLLLLVTAFSLVFAFYSSSIMARRETLPIPDAAKNYTKSVSSSEVSKTTTAVDDTGMEPSFSLDPALGLLDATHAFKIFPNVIVGGNFTAASATYDVTLATQTTLDHIHWLASAGRSWQGPISAAVFVPDVEFNVAVMYVGYLRRCFANVGENTAFHLVFPVAHPPVKLASETLARLRTIPAPCLNATGYLDQLFQSSGLASNEAFQRWRSTYPYPQSLARNVARRGSQTRFVFVTDVDIIPSIGLADGLADFLRREKCEKGNGGKCAYVVPAFEVDKRMRFPLTKAVLKRLVDEELARPFHKAILTHNSYATNYSRYFAADNDAADAAGKLHVSHPVTDFEFLYEPFYVAPASKDLPPFDERFEGYGFSRNTQAYEMHLTGWKFLVLSPAFAVHWGLQKKSSRPKWREKQNTDNRKKLEGFKRELFAKCKANLPWPPTKKPKAGGGGGSASPPAKIPKKN